MQSTERLLAPGDNPPTVIYCSDMKQVIIKVSEQDYNELLRCVRWVASDAISEPNRVSAFGLARRIEQSAEVRVSDPAE